MAADARDLPVGEVRAVLTVVGRGDLAFASLHRRPLLQHAWWRSRSFSPVG